MSTQFPHDASRCICFCIWLVTTLLLETNHSEIGPNRAKTATGRPKTAWSRNLFTRNFEVISLWKIEFLLPSWGPADFFSDTVLFWEWNRHHRWIRLPWFSALSYLTLKNWAILRKVTFVGYPWDPSLGPADFFWTLYCSGSEIDTTIGFGNLDLVHFHTSHL